MPRFTSDWFTPCITSWMEHVVPRLETMPNAHWLEIGSYEGRSALWTLENVLKGPGSDIICLDCFGLPWDIPDYERTFDSNMKGIERVLKLKGVSSNILPSLPSGRFHGVYVDGSHDKLCVYMDSLESWRLARAGAILVFDDYLSLEYPEVKPAVDDFLLNVEGQYNLLHKEWQVIIQKLSLCP